MATIVIAEAGVNHNGSLETAKALVDVAQTSGADFIKFQTFISKNLATPIAGKADYQKKFTDKNQSQLEMLSNLELTHNDHKELIRYCDVKGINFLSSAFDIDSVEMLIGLGINIFKIPSGEITNLPYLKKIGEQNGRVILSTGMSSIEEVEEAMNILKDSGTKHSNITLLHCTSEYPTPSNMVNLRAMLTLRDYFGVKVGYSDHTEGIEIGIAAVALGASVIEKHFTLDRNMQGPDHKSSLEPNELSQLVTSIRKIEVSLGDGKKYPTPGELKNREVARKSIVASSRIKKGEIFSELNLTTKRPGIGISPMGWNLVIGSIASRDYHENELIQTD
jgi:N,N'-diacetyllegionaminate synthase